MILECCDCGKEFIFTDVERERFFNMGYANPKRCKECRALKRAKDKDPYRDLKAPNGLQQGSFYDIVGKSTNVSCVSTSDFFNLHDEEQE